MWTDNEICRNFVLYKYQSESHVDSVLLNLAIINAKKSFLIEFNNYSKINHPHLTILNNNHVIRISVWKRL